MGLIAPHVRGGNVLAHGDDVIPAFFPGGRALVFKSERAVLVEQSLGVFKSALQLIFVFVVQATAGKRAQRSVFYFKLLLLTSTLLKNGIKSGEDPVSQLPGGQGLVRRNP